VLGMSEALLDGLCGGLDQRQRQAIATIGQSGQHLLELINDILDLAKIGSGKLALHYQAVQPARLLESSLDFVRPLAAKKQITLTTQIDPRIGQIWVDDRRLRQVLINLLSNAVKFTLEGGAVTLRLLLAADQQQVCFVVEDTGIGIAADQLGQLFEPFVQIDSQLNRQYTGTGMGLALVRRLVELHQGTVRVESQVGQGSQFIVTGPWRCPAEQAAPTSGPVVSAIVTPPVDHCPIDAPQKRILLADDNALNTLMFSEYLQEEGYQVVLARNGEEALAALGASRVDLVVMDIQMPVLDGLATMRQLRQQAQFQDLPIIALTALAMPGDQQRCLQAGATEYIPKPVQLKHLIQRVRHWLQWVPVT
jgi:CheY-like chemotaxis protein